MQMPWWKRTEKPQSANVRRMKITYGLASVDLSKLTTFTNPRVMVVSDSEDGSEYILFTEDEHSVLIPLDSRFGLLLREENTLATMLETGIQTHRRMLD